MTAFKVALYTLTIVLAFTSGIWEMRLKQRLTDPAIPFPSRSADADPGLLGIRESAMREQFLRSLPSERKRTYRLAVGLKCFAAIAFVVEVGVL